MKKYLFLLIIFFCFPVFADDFDVTNTITAPTCSGTTCSGGHYTALEIYNSGSQNVYSVGTRYNGQISTMRFNVPLPNNWPDGNYYSTGDLSYTLTLNMATSDWRNHFAQPFISNYSAGTNFATSSVVYVNMKKIYFNFKIPNGTTTDFLYVYLQSPNQSTTAFTGVSNWNLSSVILTANFPGSSGSGGGSSVATNNDIINSNNDNTQSIINNNNDNTNNIIDNANQNTQDIINNQNNNSLTCANDRLVNFTPLMEGYYIADGYNDTNPNFNVSNFIGVKENHYYTINFNDITGMEWGYMCWYHDQEKLSCSQYRNMTGYAATNFSVTSPTGANYLQVTYRKNSNANIKGYICTNKVDDSTNNIINNQNQNTQQQIESQKVCNIITIDKDDIVIDNSYLSTSGSVISYSGFGITDYVEIYNNYLVKFGTYGISSSICFYDSSKTLISCSSNNDIPIGNVSLPANTLYFRASINKSTNKPYYEVYSCKNGNQALTDSITDDNVDSDVGTGFFDNFSDEDFGLSQIITIPLSTIQSLTSKTCVPLQVPIPFTNSNVSLPCMTEIYETKFPSIYNLWKIVSFGIIAYLIAIDIFHIVKGFKDPESDKVEVLDL